MNRHSLSLSLHRLSMCMCIVNNLFYFAVAVVFSEYHFFSFLFFSYTDFLWVRMRWDKQANMTNNNHANYRNEHRKKNFSFSSWIMSMDERKASNVYAISVHRELRSRDLIWCVFVCVCVHAVVHRARPSVFDASSL